jgi:hypothetical protein
MKELMVHVERAVRPVRASARRKDRMREELLAHLTAIHEEELARTGEAAAARQRAFERFGEPAALTRDLQATASTAERVAWSVERWWGWQAPESAARYTFRLAALTFVVIAVLALVTSSVVVAIEGPGVDLPARLRLAGSFAIIAAVDVFVLGFLYFKMRDRLCGGLGVQRSWPRAAVLGLLAALGVQASGVAFTLLGLNSVEASLELFFLWWPGVIFAPLWLAAYGLTCGPREIRHTEWECLDIGN